MKEKNIILAARVLSVLFTPFYLPIVGLIVLFIFSYMRVLPMQFKLLVLGMVYLFTVLLPSFLIHLYRRYQGWTPMELGHKERRMIPYIISIVCYFTCFYIMDARNIPRFISIILVAGLCLVLIVGGMVGTSRMILRQHSLAQVVTGFLLGSVVAYLIVLHPAIA